MVDEPAGVVATRFLAQNDLELLDRFRFDVLTLSKSLWIHS